MTLDIGTLKGSSVTMGRYAAGVVIRARQAWTDEAGSVCPAGHLARIQQMTRERFDPACPIDVLLEAADGSRMVLRYVMRREGPRFEDLFEALTAAWAAWPGQEPAPPPAADPMAGRDTPPPAPQGTARKPLVDVRAGPVAAAPSSPETPHGARDAFDRQLDHGLALLRAGEPEQAARDWRAYRTTLWPMSDWGEAARFAQRCGDRAMALRRRGLIADPPAWRWLKEQSLAFWYAWAGQATSGGEGAALMLDVRAAERAFAEAEREHQRLGGAPIPDKV